MVTGNHRFVHMHARKGVKFNKNNPNSTTGQSIVSSFSSQGLCVNAHQGGTSGDDISAVEDFWDNQEKYFYETENNSIQHHWQKYMELEGDCVEK